VKRVLGCLALVLACGACGGAAMSEPPRAAVKAGAAEEPTPLASVLAASACAEVVDRIFAIAAGADGITDSHLLVKRCATHADRDTVTITADAYTWFAVDRDFGAIAIREFVHATAHVDVRLRVHADYRDDHMVLTLTPVSRAAIALEPVGNLELTPTNWAGFLALELAPNAGASPEALAKTKLREEAEASMAAALAKPFTLGHDARRAVTWFGAEPPAIRKEHAPVRVRVVPRGVALSGTHPPSVDPSSAELRIEGGRRVAARAICRAHAERILDADRRGDPVAIDDWTVVEGTRTLKLDALPCPWVLALRAVEPEPAIASLEVVPAAARGPGGRASAIAEPPRWVAIDEVKLDAEGAGEETSFAIGTDLWRRSLLPRTKTPLPAVLSLAPDQKVWVRATHRAGESTVIVAAADVPTTRGKIDASLSLTDERGRVLARVHVKGRVR
jgi:hypothetical protein